MRHAMRCFQRIEIGFRASPGSSSCRQDENPVVLSVLQDANSRLCLLFPGRSPLPFWPWGLGRGFLSREGNPTSSLLQSSLCLLHMPLPEDWNLHLPFLSVHLAHTGFEFLFLNKTLPKKNPPQIFHVVSFPDYWGMDCWNHSTWPVVICYLVLLFSVS